MQSKLKRRIKQVAILLVGTYIMIGTAIYYFQEKLLFFPTPLPQEFTYQFNYPFEELFFKPEKNVSINALHFKVDHPKGVIYYFHGNAGNLSRWGTIVEYLVAQQYDVLVMDYRGYGKSTGPLNEAAFYTDAQYGYNYLLNHYDTATITLYGRSLGTGIATYLASKNQAKQLILETPYYNIADVAKKRFPILPVNSLLKYKFPSNEYIAAVTCPITIFHGTEDKIVPYVSGKKLSTITPKNTTLITIKDGRHNNLVEFETYQNMILALLK